MQRMAERPAGDDGAAQGLMRAFGELVDGLTVDQFDDRLEIDLGRRATPTAGRRPRPTRDRGPTGVGTRLVVAGPAVLTPAGRAPGMRRPCCPRALVATG